METSFRYLSLLLISSACSPLTSATLKVDFTPTGGDVELGYQAYFASQEVITSFTSQSYAAFGATVTVTPSWASGAVNAVAQMVDRDGNDGTSAPALLRDWIGTDARVAGDPLTITLSGLPTGTYQWTSAHHDPHDQTGTFDVTIGDADGTRTLYGVDITDGGIDLADAAAFIVGIRSDGADVTLSFDNSYPSSGSVSEVFFVMNGFEISDSSEVSGEYPADGATGVTLPTSLSWEPPVTYVPVSYDVYIGTNPVVRSNPVTTESTTRVTPLLEPFTTYFWAVDAFDGTSADPGPTWTFTTSDVASAGDLVDGNLILFDTNGAWTWYSDERAIVDPANNRIVVGSLANADGPGGSPMDGDVQGTLFDLETGSRETTELRHGLTSYGGGDDHNAPAFMSLPNGDTLSIYAGHNNNYLSYFRTYDESVGAWGAERTFNWRGPGTGGSSFQTSYSNIFHLTSEGGADGRIYLIARTDDKSPNFIYSDDSGLTWTYGGQLTTSGDVGYVNGYFKYWSNGIDRIDFVATEHHPRDYNTSLYHGYIKDGQLLDSSGSVVDGDIFDKLDLSSPNDFTPVFLADTVVNGITMTKVWNTDIMRYDDGIITALFKARANNSETDHRVFFARFDGTTWSTTYLGKAGPKLYGTEQDYTGLGALDPDNPNRIFISTPFDPSTEAALDHHEIFEGVTVDNGLSWTWKAVTTNSTTDNFRPIVPQWDGENTAVLWFRGEYSTAQAYDAAVVGVLERAQYSTGKVIYVDADSGNTSFLGGSALTTTGPNGGAGAADNSWHMRTELGNGAGVLTADENGEEDVPALLTEVDGLDAGLYDVFIYFWSTESADSRVSAHLPGHNPVLFRRMGCQQPSPAQLVSSIQTRDGELHLYQGYVGRVMLNSGEKIQVVVDDPDSSGTERVYYDGIGYAQVASPLHIESGASLMIKDTDSTYTSVTNEGTLIVNGGSLIVAGDLANSGTLRLFGEFDPTVTGSMVNNGLLDLIGFKGSLPDGFLNNGTVLDNSSLHPTTIRINGTDAIISAPGYAGHDYELLAADELDGDWNPVDGPVSGEGIGGAAQNLVLTHQNGFHGPKGFYRVKLTPSP